MCHRRRDWSRTSSRASEPDEEADDESAWVGARAKDLLVTVVSGGMSESADETPEPDRETPKRPTVEADPETTSADPTESEVSEETDEPESERDEDPIPADD